MKSCSPCVLLALVSLLPCSAGATSPEPAPKLCAVYFDADMIARVHVLKATYIVDGKDDFVEGYRYKVKVIDAYLGKPARLITVESDNSQSRLLLKPGRDYILFAKRDPSKNMYEAWANGEGIQGIDGEPFTKVLADSIEKVRRDKFATIEGEIRGQGWDLAPHAKFVISGEGQRFEVASDRKGQFSQSLPPGTYRVELPPELSESSYSFHDIPQKPIQVRAGQCAQIQLQLR